MAITDGGYPCYGSTVYDDLVGCAAAACPSECPELIQYSGPVGYECGDCLTIECSAQLNDCSNDI